MKNGDLLTLPELVQEYLNYLSVIKAKSNLTILEYASDLRLFFAYLTKKSPDESLENIDISSLNLEFIKKVTPAEAYAFLNYCKNVLYAAVLNNDDFGIAVSNFEGFNYSCCNYKAETLENCDHIFDLPAARETVLCFFKNGKL